MINAKNLPLFSRMMLWVNERFPLTNTPLFIILYILSFIVGYSDSIVTENPARNIIAGSLLSISFFLLLRVIDEHKDYKEDCINHPKRILQSGVINLFHLKVLGVICLSLQLVLMLFIHHANSNLLLAWGIMLIWTLLMTREFFAPVWLNKHFAIYALSHTLIMPFFIWWTVNLAKPGITLTSEIVILMLLSFVASLSFEITRKCKGADEERQEIVSWSSLIGRRRAVFAILILQGIMIVLEYKLILACNTVVPLWFYLINMLVYLCCFLQMQFFLRQPTISNRKRNEAIVGISMLSGYLLSIIAIHLN